MIFKASMEIFELSGCTEGVCLFTAPNFTSLALCIREINYCTLASTYCGITCAHRIIGKYDLSPE